MTDIRRVRDSHFGRHTECADLDVVVASPTRYMKIPVGRSEVAVLRFVTTEATVLTSRVTRDYKCAFFTETSCRFIKSLIASYSIFFNRFAALLFLLYFQLNCNV